MAEALAFGTLALRRGVGPTGVTPSDYFSIDPSLGLNRGHYAVRLSGQDSERGTFNQRHAALYDQITGKRYGCYSAPCSSHYLMVSAGMLQLEPNAMPLCFGGQLKHSIAGLLKDCSAWSLSIAWALQ